jgi:branched-chain amino acid transport system permease protein
MQLGVTTLINMLVLSSMYILVALGFVFLFNIMGILNFAHGVIYMVGGYICFQFAVGFGLNIWLSLVLTVAVVSCLGLFLERFCFGPFFRDLNFTIVICIGIILVLENAVNMTVGTSTRSIPAFVPGILKAGIISLSMQRLITFIIGGALLATTLWFFRNTKLGQQMQAASQNLEGAALQGISIHRVSAIACVIACGLAALAGCLMGAYLNLTPFMGDDKSPGHTHPGGYRKYQRHCLCRPDNRQFGCCFTPLYQWRRQSGCGSRCNHRYSAFSTSGILWPRSQLIKYVVNMGW